MSEKRNFSNGDFQQLYEIISDFNRQQNENMNELRKDFNQYAEKITKNSVEIKNLYKEIKEQDKKISNNEEKVDGLCTNKKIKNGINKYEADRLEKAHKRLKRIVYITSGSLTIFIIILQLQDKIAKLFGN